MVGGWTRIGSAFAVAQSLTGSALNVELVPNKRFGACGFSQGPMQLAQIVIDMASLSGAPTEVQVELFWDSGGDQYATRTPLSGTIQIGKTTATDATAIINVTDEYHILFPYTDKITKVGADLTDRSIKMWARVTLIGGSSPTATANIQVSFYHNGV